MIPGLSGNSSRSTPKEGLRLRPSSSRSSLSTSRAVSTAAATDPPAEARSIGLMPSSGTSGSAVLTATTGSCGSGSATPGNRDTFEIVAAESKIVEPDLEVARFRNISSRFRTAR